MGMRTVCREPFRVSQPLLNWSYLALPWLIVTVMVCNRPGRTVNRFGDALTVRSPAAAVTSYVSGSLLTLFTVRVVVSVPISDLSWIEGELTWWPSGSATHFAQSVSVESRTSPGSSARFGLARPAPCAKGEVVPSVSPTWSSGPT